MRHAVGLNAFLVSALLCAAASGREPAPGAVDASESPAEASVTQPADEAASLEPALSVQSAARSAPVVSRRYTLERCLQMAEGNYPKVHEARAKLAKTRGQLSEARTAAFGEFNATAGLALAPTLRGTNVYSPNSDVTLSSNMALAWQYGIEGVVPLWTFGKITNLVDAASAQVKASEYDVQKSKNEVKLSVRQAYYGIQLAQDALDLLRSATRRIDKYLVRMQAAVDEGDGDDIQLLKLRMYRAELDARESEATRQAEIAAASLAFLIGARERVQIPDEPLRKIPHYLAPLARYLTAARLFRPEINMARAGVIARQAQLALQRSRYFPDLGLGLSANFGDAPEVDDQQNPFVKDQANFRRYGAGLVMRWKLDFLPQSAREAQAQAELDAMRATEQYALGGVGVEVQAAFHEATDAERRLGAYTSALNYARQWLITVQQGIDVGTFDNEDIVDPAKEYALKRFAQMQAVFDYNVALAKLSLATGWDAVAPAKG